MNSTLPRSLVRDEHDQTALHSPVWREELDSPVVGMREQVPFFYTRAGAVLPLEGMYRGGHAFLIANGPSFAGLDKTQLHQRWTMTLNNGAKSFRGNANCTVDDPSRFSMSIWLDPTIMKLVPMSQFEKPLWDNRLLKTEAGWVQRWEESKLRVGECPNVVGYRRNEKFHAPRWLTEETINWGNHGKWGGGRSVLLAALRLLHLLGFRHVYLLGVDFEMSASKRYHFEEGRTAHAIKGNMETYDKLQQWLAELQPLFLKAGYHVWNCNPESRLTAFPFLSYEDALAASQAQIGDVAREKTEGMYSRQNEKAEADQKKPAVVEANTHPGVRSGQDSMISLCASQTVQYESREFLEPLLAAVNDAEVRTDPFVHLQIAQVFPGSLYRDLLAHLPESRHYTELRHTDAIQPNGKSARLRFSFGDKEMASLPPEQRAFWERMLVALRDPTLEKAFREKLRAGMRERFCGDLGEIVLRPVPELIRDLTGYHIGAHTDIFKKVITTQYYLPEDNGQEPLGTTFYRRQDDGKFEPALRMPFLPAMGYAFAVNARSWHGVDTVPVQPRPRNSLMLTYYLGKARK